MAGIFTADRLPGDWRDPEIVAADEASLLVADQTAAAVPAGASVTVPTRELTANGKTTDLNTDRDNPPYRPVAAGMRAGPLIHAVSDTLVSDFTTTAQFPWTEAGSPNGQAPGHNSVAPGTTRQAPGHVSNPDPEVFRVETSGPWTRLSGTPGSTGSNGEPSLDEPFSSGTTDSGEESARSNQGTVSGQPALTGPAEPIAISGVRYGSGQGTGTDGSPNELAAPQPAQRTVALWSAAGYATGRPTLNLDMYQPELGHVQVHVTLVDQTVRAKVATEYAEIRDFMIHHQGRLEAALNASGLNLGELRVLLDSQGRSQSDPGWAFRPGWDTDGWHRENRTLSSQPEAHPGASDGPPVLIWESGKLSIFA